MIKERDILHKTHYGLDIYAHILREYYPSEVVLNLTGTICAPAKNPFNDNKATLIISKNKDSFCHYDSEKPEFKGSPFDFSVSHYKLNGNELLQKLNQVLNLRIGEDWDFYGQKRKADTKQNEGKSLSKFSYFNRPVTNTIPYCEASLSEVYLVLKSESYKEKTEGLRAISDSIQARRYKAMNFDYATFSGIFTKRNENALIQHSGLITFDFDHMADLPQLKKALLDDQYFETQLMFISPSGDGLKWIISIDLKECSHQQWFQAIAAYIKATYQLDVDKSGKDISRACFLPYAPDVYINPNLLKTNSHETI